ncbi:hypothetical protein L3X38_008781 [Prunus dulcis]|uniref:Uncharacterized protein n=1 Tax=Prunus dulcis TaxID=3755 RepID=A0AAD4ZXA7_PRUDU|nr:hypothetical protein L3X38_008781 [Prunus dulcis]
MGCCVLCQDKCVTSEGTSCRLAASESAQKSCENKKKSEKKAKTTETGRPREYHLKGFSFALQIWAYEVFPALAALDLVVHKDNAYIPRMLHWRSHTSPCFYELMSQVFENREVDVQLLRPSVIDKQQPTYASVEEKDEDIDETASLLSSSKGKLASTELRTLKHGFQRTKDDLAKVASSNRALRNRVRREGHEDLCSPHMNEGGDNDLSPLHDYVSPPTESVAMETQLPDDGAKPSAAMVVEEAEMATSVSHLQVHEAGFAPVSVFYLLEGKQVEMPQQTKLKLTGNPRGRLVTYSETQSLMGLKEIAESLSGTLTKSTDAIVQDDIEGPGMKPRNLLRFE